MVFLLGGFLSCFIGYENLNYLQNATQEEAEHGHYDVLVLELEGWDDQSYRNFTRITQKLDFHQVLLSFV